MTTATCGSSTYAAPMRAASAHEPDDANTCQYNIQPLLNRTTGLNTRSHQRRDLPDEPSVVQVEDGRQLLPVEEARAATTR